MLTLYIHTGLVREMILSLLAATRPRALTLACRAHTLTARRVLRPVLATGDTGEADMAALLKSLNAGLNSWTDFDDSSSAAPPPPAPGAGVSKKRAASGKSKAAKAYLRKGPKRDSPLKSRLMSTSSAGGSADATSDRAQPARVRIEETGSAKGRQATVVRGLEALLIHLLYTPR